MAKAEAAEQKAASAGDAASYERSWREAGRLWERAADRETDAKRRVIYAANAERARTLADTPQEPGEVEPDANAADADATEPESPLN